MSAASVPLADIVAYLDQYLRIRDVPDDGNAHNGLQVENQGAVGRLVAAVDASLATIEGLGAPVRAGTAPALLLVHHGLFWDGSQPVTGRRYRRLRALLERDAALYAAHIPLDLHPEVGNNAGLARLLALEEPRPFGQHKGVLIGVAGRAPGRLRDRGALAARLAEVLGIELPRVRVIPGGPAAVSTIGVITGGAGSAILQAREAGCDTFVTGEGAAHTYFDAMEFGVNVLYAGHYATETIGVRLLAEHLAARFGIPWEFHDHPTGM
ncbi:MAG: Nif3-like dinuclear metal center hexameric protein [Gemmatimonadota bacterium]|nr:Nif3-like dinuclear metal center hexameric protein [Gemmatimonadota bacterium]